MRRAARKLDKLDLSLEALHRKPLPAAVDAFLKMQEPIIAHGTMRNYRRVMNHFLAVAAARETRMLDEVLPELIDLYRESRKIAPLTWVKELQVLRHFFGFCCERDWIQKNPAKRVQMPRNLKPKSKAPYTANEIISIIAACDTFGRKAYERTRARAMVLMLRYAALRVSDLATLKRSSVRGGRIVVSTMKTGAPINLPVPAELQRALDMVPLPQGADGNCEYFFWSGQGSTRAVIRGVTRTLGAVFRKSGVKGAHAHRFRHTLATEILERGGTAEDAANILGNSPAMIRKHYAQQSIGRQERIFSLMQTVHAGTQLAQTEKQTAVC
ncbi:MAG: tyrosine-type recombinase/integrase [Bryobacteraceae bacterium]